MDAWIGARNEAIIRAGDQEHRLVFTNRALAEAERTIGKSILEILNGFDTNESGLNELAHLMRSGLEAARRESRQGGRPYTLNQAFGILDAVGFGRVAATVLQAAAAVLSYEGDDDAAEDDYDPNA